MASHNKLEPVMGAAKLYEELKSAREPYLRRARENAKLTVPGAMKGEGQDGNTDYEDTHQSVGALGVNSLASKLTSAVLPPGVPFFRLQPDHATAMELSQDASKKAEVDAGFARIEQTANVWVETSQVRVTTSEAMKQLIVAGNGLLYLPPEEEGVKLYKLPNYVVKRDPVGNVLHIIATDQVAYMALTPELQALVKNVDPTDLKASVLVYTHCQRLGDEWYSYQEIEEELVKGSENTYPLNATPFIPLRMTKEDDEDYGRAYVDDYRGDLNTLSKLSKALNEMAGAAARVLYGVEPTYQGSLKKLATTKNGGFVTARKGEIHGIQLDKYADMQVAQAQAEKVERRINQAFLMTASVQRQAERVTAEEIRAMAGELEELLGGLYSLLTQEYQLPLARRILVVLESLGKIPELPPEIVEPTVTTGVEALGRGQNIQKFQMFLSIVGGIPNALESVKTNSLLTAVANACDIDAGDFVMTEEEIMQKQQEAQQAAMMQQAAPGIASGVGGAIRDGVASGDLEMGAMPQ